MGSIADITEVLAADLRAAISEHRIDFVEKIIPENPASEYLAVNNLLYGTALLCHDNGKIHDDRKKRLVFCNFEAAEIFGLTIEEMLGMLSEELAPDVGSIRIDRDLYLEQSLQEPVKLHNLIRWQWQPDKSKREILIDAVVFPYSHDGDVSNAASISLKGYSQP